MYIYIYVCIHVCVCMYIYIYIYIYRERERDSLIVNNDDSINDTRATNNNIDTDSKHDKDRGKISHARNRKREVLLESATKDPLDNSSKHPLDE